MARLALVLLVTALCTNLSLAGDMFNDIIYHDQNQSSFNTGYQAQGILPGGCTKPDIGWNDPWSQGQQHGQWNDFNWKYDRPGYWDDNRWPQKVPRYYRRRDRISRFEFRHSDNNLYAPGNEWRWFERDDLRRRRRRHVIVDDWGHRRHWDNHGNWWHRPNNYMAYNINNWDSRSYGYWDGNNMVTGFDSPNTSIRFGMNNRTYWDPWTLSPQNHSSMHLGLNLRF